MTDFDQLLLILGAIYLAECVLWLRRGSVALVAWLGVGRYVTHPGSLFATDGAGPNLASLLPWDLAPIVSQWRVSVGPSGVVGHAAQALNPAGRPPGRGVFVAFADNPRWRVVENQLYAGKTPVAVCASTAEARYWRDLLQALTNLPESARTAALERRLRASIHPARSARRWHWLCRCLRGLRCGCTLLFVFVFVLLPVLLHATGVGRYWLLLIPAYFLLLLGTVWTFHRLHRRLYPELPAERWKHTLIMLLAPTAAMRSAQVLARDFLRDCEATAVVQALGGSSARREMIPQVVRDLHHPMAPVCPPELPESAHATERWFRQRLVAMTMQRLTTAGVDVPAMLAAPTAESARSVAYCPRCLAQFTSAQTRCAACGGMMVQPLPPGK